MIRSTPHDGPDGVGIEEQEEEDPVWYVTKKAPELQLGSYASAAAGG